MQPPSQLQETGAGSDVREHHVTEAIVFDYGRLLTMFMAGAELSGAVRCADNELQARRW